METALLVDQETQLGYIFLKPDTQDNPTALMTPSDVETCQGVPVICFHGSGYGNHTETWLPVFREIGKRTPVLFYERRGAGQRTGGQSYMQTIEEAVQDLTRLLRSLQLGPPFVLVAHSYGGAVAREFLQYHTSEVAGMVLAETGQETFTKSEQEQYERQILNARPLSVIHANSLLSGGPGATSPSAEHQRLAAMWAKEDERLKKVQMRLSSNSRYVRLADCGHHVVRDRPDIIVEEVCWVINNQAAAAAPLSKLSTGKSLVSLVHRLFRFHRPNNDHKVQHKT